MDLAILEQSRFGFLIGSLNVPRKAGIERGVPEHPDSKHVVMEQLARLVRQTTRLVSQPWDEGHNDRAYESVRNPYADLL